MQEINNKLFDLINASENSPIWIICFAKFFAENMIIIAPIITIILFVIHTDEYIYSPLIIRISTALLISLLFSWLLSHLFFIERPFVQHIGNNFLYHIPDNSFPSDHSTIMFTFALSILFWYQHYLSIILLIIAIIVSWSRIYLGLHWPTDIAVSFLIGIVSCIISSILLKMFGRLLHKKNL